MVLRDKLSKRAAEAGVSLSDAAAEKLAEYFELLRKWNRKVALTALPVESAGDAAIDRLLIEPVAAMKFIPKPASTLIDIGSGGGSPAIPLKITAPEVSMRMVESKTRKAAFLREAVRILGLERTHVEPLRLEELLTRPSLHDAADAITMRAVRVDGSLLQTAQSLLRPDGCLCVFTNRQLSVREFAGSQFLAVGTYPLIPHSGSYLAVFRRAIVRD